ncbi:MAG TPA: hypothetical protein VE631_11125 [Alphaproteobacteria bacterium]|nr:hypothetical protein [Alphaproteobacteria bacterium]
MLALLVAPLAGAAAAPARPADGRQQAAEMPPPPPSSFEERLADYRLRQQRIAAARKARQQVRLNRLSGAGQPAGARAGEAAGLPISLPRLFNAAVGVALYAVASSALAHESGRGGDGGAASGNTSAATSTSD